MNFCNYTFFLFFFLCYAWTQLFERDPSRRLGIVGNIRGHQFFKTVNWPALERKEVEPPFKPKVVCFSSHIRFSFFLCVCLSVFANFFLVLSNCRKLQMTAVTSTGSFWVRNPASHTARKAWSIPWTRALSLASHSLIQEWSIFYKSDIFIMWSKRKKTVMFMWS